MADHVVDTNVLLVGSAAHPDSPFGDSDLPKDLQEQVFKWLAEFRGDEERALVLDEAFRIYGEYQNKMTGQDYGLQVVHFKMERSLIRQAVVDYDADGHGIVPIEFAGFDPSDRTLLAALLANVERTILVNATDTDWLEIETALKAADARVEHLLEDWLRQKFAEKHER